MTFDLIDTVLTQEFLAAEKLQRRALCGIVLKTHFTATT